MFLSSYVKGVICLIAIAMATVWDQCHYELINQLMGTGMLATECVKIQFQPCYSRLCCIVVHVKEDLHGP